LPHEIAHQWWGNTVSPADYRSEWLFEAMSSYSALEFLEQSKGRATLDAVLESYRQDLLSTENGIALESAGPVDFGDRLLDNSGMLAWHVIVYEKGAWILHMLRMRLGDEGFRTLQRRLLQNFQNKLVTNEDFRHLAEGLVPEDQSDKSLNVFFDNWVYATGIPKVTLKNSGTNLSLRIGGVDEAFALDLPLHCVNANGADSTVWFHAGAGDNSFEMPAGTKSCELPKQADYLYQPVN
jgi:aminopeptidase N